MFSSMKTSTESALSGVVSETSDEPDVVGAIETAASGQMVMSAKELMRILNAKSGAADDPRASLTPLERELAEQA